MNENLELKTAVKNIENLIPIDFISNFIFIGAFISLLILILLKTSYFKKIKKEEHSKIIKIIFDVGMSFVFFSFFLLVWKLLNLINDYLPSEILIPLVLVLFFITLRLWYKDGYDTNKN
jgi:hypothetical protein